MTLRVPMSSAKSRSFFGAGFFHAPAAQSLPQPLFALGAQPFFFRLLGGGFFALERAQPHGLAAFQYGFGRFGELQRLVQRDIYIQKPQADALADNAAPFFVAKRIADAESGQFIVAVARYPIIALAAQHVNHIARGKALADAIHAA